MFFILRIITILLFFNPELNISLLLFPLDSGLIFINILFRQQAPALWTTPQGVGIESTATLTRWLPSPPTAEIHTMRLATTVTVQCPLAIVSHSILSIERVPALAASYAVYHSHK